MNYFMIAAGGTGAMCAKAFLFLAAAGCVDKSSKYHILLMDKDQHSDAVTDCENLLDKYEKMRQQMLGKTDVYTFPEVELHKWNFTDEIVDTFCQKTKLAAATLTQMTLRKLLNPTGDDKMARILSTMYTDKELDTDLEKGFYGNPNIGAPVFDYVQERFLSDKVTRNDGSEWQNTFMTELRNALYTGKTYVYLMGSLFGGTGATVIPNVVLALRSLKDSKGKAVGMENLVLGASVIMPYFKLPNCEEDSVERLAKVMPVDGKFAGQTRDALAYYDSSGLLSNMMNLLLLGSSCLDVTSELYARGGQQRQHSHIVILLAAVAASRFFSNNLGSMKDAVNATPITPRGELLVWKGNPDDDGKHQTLSSRELGITDEYGELMRFLRFSVLVGYYMRLRFSQDAAGMMTWNEVLGTCRQKRDGRDNPLDPKKLKEKDIVEHYQMPVKDAGEICKAFIQFMYDVALSGYDWSGYHEKTKQETGDGYYQYETTEKVKADVTNHFSERWVDLANLMELKNLLEATCLKAEITDRKTLNQICSFDMLDEGRAGQRVEKYPDHIGQVYEAALKKLGLQKTLLSKMKREDVHFCELYDALYKLV